MWVYYIVDMVHYDSTIRKQLRKGMVPQTVFRTIHNAFISIDSTKDFDLFDIKEVKGEFRRSYFRLRKGKYRAIFYQEDTDIFVVAIGKREEVYRS